MVTMTPRRVFRPKFCVSVCQISRPSITFITHLTSSTLIKWPSVIASFKTIASSFVTLFSVRTVTSATPFRYVPLRPLASFSIAYKNISKLLSITYLFIFLLYRTWMLHTFNIQVRYNENSMIYFIPRLLTLLVFCHVNLTFYFSQYTSH